MMLCNIHSCSAETDENRFMTAERIDSFSENLDKGWIFMKKYLTVLSFLLTALLCGESALAVQKKIELVIPGCIA